MRMKKNLLVLFSHRWNTLLLWKQWTIHKNYRAAKYHLKTSQKHHWEWGEGTAFKQKKRVGWRDGSMAKSPCCSCSWPRFSLQASHGGSQSSLPRSERVWPSFDIRGPDMHSMSIHTHRQNTHSVSHRHVDRPANLDNPSWYSDPR